MEGDRRTREAILLCTAQLGKSDDSDTRPLSAIEWSRFVVWLVQHQREPSMLMDGNLSPLLTGWTDPKITVSRLETLLNRGLALEKWGRAGLWLIKRADPAYPTRLKRRLRRESPPILFRGCGNQSLLQQGPLAVVGSRNAKEEDLDFARRLGEDPANQDISIVSGGARGVDQTVMHGALERGGSVVGVLASDCPKNT